LNVFTRNTIKVGNFIPLFSSEAYFKLTLPPQVSTLLECKGVHKQASMEAKNDDSKIEYLSRIRWRYDLMSKKNKSIADYIFKHRNEVKHLSINQIAAKVGTNPPAITRFSQYLGFQGFAELKFHLEKEILTANSPEDLISSSDSVEMIKQKMILQNSHIITNTLSLVDGKKIEQVVKAFLKASKIELFAEGGSAATLGALYSTLINADLPGRFFSDAFLAINAASQLKLLDVAICVSYSGSCINGVNFLKEADLRKATTIAITGHANSQLARIAKITLLTTTKFNNDIRDLHSARMSELCVIGLLQNVLFSRMEDHLGEKLENTKEATRRTRFKSGYDILL